MTDTYDKENHWYGHNSGECPVHPETMVAAVTEHAGTFGLVRAGDVRWTRAGEPDDIIAFCITRLYREPRKAREWWVNIHTGGAERVFQTREDADLNDLARIECIHVREVLGDDDAH